MSPESHDYYEPAAPQCPYVVEEPVCYVSRKYKMALGTKLLLSFSLLCNVFTGLSFIINRDFERFDFFQWDIEPSGILQLFAPFLLKFMIYIACIALMFIPRISFADEFLYIISVFACFEEIIANYSRSGLLLPWWVQCFLVLSGFVFRLSAILTHLWLINANKQ